MAKINKKAEYLKNELRSYNSMKEWIENDSYVFDDRISYYDKKIKEIDIELSAGNAKGIEYGYTPTTGVKEPLLTLLAEQEKYIKRRDELVDLKQEDVYGFKERVKFVEDCLNKLDEAWKRSFVIDIYCNGKTVDEIEKIYNYSRAQLFRFKDMFIYLMV